MINTAVAVFIKGRKLLMEKRSNDRNVYAGFLMCPSGHINDTESSEQALKREMKEELGINILETEFLFDIHNIDPFSKKDFCHNFMLVKSFEGRIKKSREAEKLVWMSYDELKKHNPVLIVRKLVDKLHEMDLI